MRRIEPGKKTRQIVSVGFFTAVLSVLAIFQIPMPSGVPVTLQNFAVPLCGYVLGSRMGLAATVIYYLLGAVGLPVFAGMKGGPGVIFGPTGGFLIGFMFLAFFSGWGMERRNKLAYWIGGGIGLILCYSFGALWFSFLSGGTFWESFLLVCAPYAIKDMISLVGAGVAGAAIRRAIAASGALVGLK